MGESDTSPYPPAPSESRFARQLRITRIIIPKIPSVLVALFIHLAHLSHTSVKWDLRLAAVVFAIRAFLSPNSSSTLGKQQSFSVRDPGIGGGMWVSKQIIPSPNEGDGKFVEERSETDGIDKERSTDVLHHIQAAIDAIMPADVPSPSEVYTLPEIRPVEVEWIGHRTLANPSRPGPRPDLSSEDEHYRAMMDDPHLPAGASSKRKRTVLYIHGGALYLMDPSSSRPIAHTLASSTRSRVMSVRYRLAPQHPFPAALLDCFVAYLALLSPPPDCVHEAVPAEEIVWAGESAGGTLCFALLQFVLTLHRLHRASNPSAPADSLPTVRVWGKDVEVPLPSSIVVQSPWTDLTQCLAVLSPNAKWDYLPVPPREDEGKKAWNFPPDELWPAKPPRAHLYCRHELLTHPLVSPMAVDVAVAGLGGRTSWEGAPPVFIQTGQEILTDEGRVTARHLARDGVVVEYWEFEAMPHVFSVLVPASPATKLLYEGIADFVDRAAASPSATGDARRADADVGRSQGTYVSIPSISLTPVVLAELMTDVNDVEVVQRMKDAQERKGKGFGREDAVTMQV